jgi:hypothetical protein
VALNDAALVVAANAINTSIGWIQAHSAAPNAAYTTNQIGTRVAATGTVDADGDITWSTVAFTGLPASGPVTHISYWSASTGGTNYGGSALTGDLAANASGAYTVSSVTETSTAA